MSSEERVCVSCGSTFWTRYWANKCSTCQQTEKLTQQAELDREQNYNLQQQEMNQQRELGLLNAAAAQLTALAVERQTRAIFESSISQQHAYNEGYQYIDHNFGFNNTANLQMHVNENGGIDYTINIPYITPTLQSKFKEGLNDKLKAIRTPRFNHMKEYAEYAGKQVAENTLNPYFTLYTGLVINGVEIKTKAFDSKFERRSEEHTSELQSH